MAPHLLHWRILQALRERNFKTYDFGGIEDTLWPGVTRFKMGFGGTVHAFPPSSDYVFRSPLYQLYRLQRRIRGGLA
jgi:lipid II:glycine glycyltransferase (peptidoglycan interpeptide bridge formation enzyme)